MLIVYLLLLCLLEHFVCRTLSCMSVKLFLYPKKPLLVSLRLVTEMNPPNLRRRAGSSVKTGSVFC